MSAPYPFWDQQFSRAAFLLASVLIVLVSRPTATPVSSGDECLACSQIACNAAACHVTVLMWHAVCEPESLPVAAVGVSAALHNGCPALFMLRVGIWLGPRICPCCEAGNVPHCSCCGSVRMGML